MDADNRADTPEADRSRPATVEDMQRFWPDKSRDELEQVHALIASIGGQLTVGPADDEDDNR